MQLYIKLDLQLYIHLPELPSERPSCESDGERLRHTREPWELTRETWSPRVDPGSQGAGRGLPGFEKGLPWFTS